MKEEIHDLVGKNQLSEALELVTKNPLFKHKLSKPKEAKMQMLNMIKSKNITQRQLAAWLILALA